MGLTLERQKGSRGGTDMWKTKGLEVGLTFRKQKRWNSGTDIHGKDRNSNSPAGDPGAWGRSGHNMKCHHAGNSLQLWPARTCHTQIISGCSGPLNSHYHSNTKQNFITFSQFLSTVTNQEDYILSKKSLLIKQSVALLQKPEDHPTLPHSLKKITDRNYPPQWLTMDTLIKLSCTK